MKHITRKIARVEACKFTYDDVRRLNGKPDMDCCECNNWLDGFGSWIESAYNGKLVSYEEMAAEFNANCSRKFRKRDGKTVNYCRVLEEYLSFMCLAVNYGKNYTVSRFKTFVKENYKEVLVNG